MRSLLPFVVGRAKIQNNSDRNESSARLEVQPNERQTSKRNNKNTVTIVDGETAVDKMPSHEYLPFVGDISMVAANACSDEGTKQRSHTHSLNRISE